MRRILTDDGSWTFESERYGETYRSRRGAARESMHVFLEGSGVAARLAAGLATRVLEIGLGTTLNLVLTASAAVRTGAPLEYVSVEREPLPAHALETLDLAAVGDPSLVAALLEWRRSWREDDPSPQLAWGPHRFRVAIGDAVTVPLPGAVDAVYLDGFSPRVNPELWTPSALTRFAACLAPGGALSTYSVSGAVRRALAAAGLEVARQPGPPGGKRESLVARRPAATPGGP